MAEGSSFGEVYVTLRVAKQWAGSMERFNSTVDESTT